jgi:hypothetical protein
VTVLICARRRVPFFTAFILGEIAGAAAAKAWQVAEDVHELAEAARDADPLHA